MWFIATAVEMLILMAISKNTSSIILMLTCPWSIKDIRVLQ